jgi:hypothetical protein
MKVEEFFILETFNNIETACVFLARIGFIKNIFCNVCDSMRLIPLIKRARLVEGYVWWFSKPCHS